MARTKSITEKLVNRLRPGDCYMSCKVTGFGVRRTSKRGTVKFFVRRVINGRDILRTIGPYPEYSVKSARKAALELLRSLGPRCSLPAAPLLRAPDKLVSKLDRIVELLEPAPIDSTTFAEAVAKLGEKIYEGKKERTKTTYRNYLKSQLLPHFGEMPIGEITGADIREWYDNYKGQNGGKPTQPYKIFRGIMNLACGNNIIKTVPHVKIKGANKSGEGEALRHRDYVRVVAFLQRKLKSDPKVQDWALLVGATTGERSFSLCSLHTSEVDFVAGEATKVRKGVGENVTTLPYLSEALETLKKIRPKRAGFFFPHQYIPGHHLSSGSLRLYFQAMCSDLGITLPSGKTPVVHSLRHSFVSELARRGMNPTTIQTYVGHAKIATTMRYIHADRELAKREAAELRLMKNG